MTHYCIFLFYRGLFYNGKNNMQAWGLIVLLVSKAAGHSPDVPEMEQDKSAGVLHSQRALAEVTEMIRTSHLVHKGLVNMQPPIKVDAPGKRKECIQMYICPLKTMVAGSLFNV